MGKWFDLSKFDSYKEDNRREVKKAEGTDNVIMVIRVPGAKRGQKPVYINNDLFGGTFRRNWEGDYHCTRLQVKTMLRDQAGKRTDAPGRKI